MAKTVDKMTNEEEQKAARRVIEMASKISKHHKSILANCKEPNRPPVPGKQT